MSDDRPHPPNYDRMIALAEDVFGMRDDPDQLTVTPEVMARLQAIHPATLGEVSDTHGPVAWLLVIPTTQEVMERFLARSISERQLLEMTPPGIPYTAVYLCSALVLEEHRGKGHARRLAIDAVRAIQRDHSIETIYVWPMSSEGRSLAGVVAGACGLPVRERPSTAEFYATLPPLGSLEALTEPGHHVPLPDDWSVAVADVQNSTGAIARGEYKSVNTVGVSVIAGILNALKPLEVPYVFGGDGAVVCFPTERTTHVRTVLAATGAMARERFGLDLRMAVVPMRWLGRQGHALRVGRYRISPHVSQAAFSGDGIVASERLLKSGGLPAGCIVAPDPSASADYSGLECRWAEVPSPSEETVALIVQATGEADRALDEYRKVLEKVRSLYGDERASHPVRAEDLRVTLSSFVLRHEERVRTWGLGRGRRWRYAVGQRLAIVIGWWFFLTGRRSRATDWGRYKADLVAHTDHQKMDGQLRIVVSGERAQRELLRSYLQGRADSGAIRFGMHAATSAILTCLVFQREREHVHFVDASGGGYAEASKNLKS